MAQISGLQSPTWLSGLNIGPLGLSGAQEQQMGPGGQEGGAGGIGMEGGMGLDALSQLLAAQQGDIGASNLGSLFAPIGGTLGAPYGIAGRMGQQAQVQGAGGAVDPLAILTKILGLGQKFLGLASPTVGGPGEADLSGLTPEQQRAFQAQRAGERQDYSGYLTAGQTSPSDQFAQAQDVLYGQEGVRPAPGIGGAGEVGRGLNFPQIGSGAVSGGTGLLNLLNAIQGGNVPGAIAGGLQGAGGLAGLLKGLDTGVGGYLGPGQTALGGLGGILGLEEGIRGLLEGRDPMQSGLQLAGGGLGAYNAAANLSGGALPGTSDLITSLFPQLANLGMEGLGTAFGGLMLIPSLLSLFGTSPGEDFFGILMRQLQGGSYQNFPEKLGSTLATEQKGLNLLLQGIPKATSQDELSSLIAAFKNIEGANIGGYGQGSGPFEVPGLPGAGGSRHEGGMFRDFGPQVEGIQALINQTLSKLPKGPGAGVDWYTPLFESLWGRTPPVSELERAQEGAPRESISGL